MGKGVAGAFSDDIAIDLGTANTLVHVKGRGIIIDEPSVVAVLSRGLTREILGVGQRAKALAAASPDRVELVRPLRDGVVADFVAAEEMLRQFIRRTKTLAGFRRPQILVCVPAGATPVERRAVYETALSVGARAVHIIEEPVAAAIGLGLLTEASNLAMVVDIGGGTTDIAVLSEGRVIEARSLKCAGNAMDEAIVRFVRREHQLLIGEANAERMKIEAGTALEAGEEGEAEAHIQGRDLATGRLKRAVLTPRVLAQALAEPLGRIADFVQRAMVDLAPDVSSRLCEQGAHLTGGGALLDGIGRELERRTGLKFTIPENPMHCVVRGSAAVLENLAEHEDLLIGA